MIRYEQAVKKLDEARKRYAGTKKAQMRYDKLVSEATAIILEKGNKTFGYEDYRRINLALYGKSDKIKSLRIRGELMQSDVKKDIAKNLRYYLTKEKLGNETIVKELKKAITSAKTTTDHLNIIKTIKDLENDGKTNVVQTKKVDFRAIRDGIEGTETVTETIKGKIEPVKKTG